jgi:hypothetical protein
MTIPDRVILNTLEQILSADMNRVGELAGKAAQDALLGLTKGVDFSGTFPSPVREGLDASVGAGLSVDISAGELMWFDPGVAVGADVSRYKLGRLEATYNQPLNVADPVNPRIDLISAAVVDLDEDNTARNVLTLPARTVTPTNVDKTRRGDVDIASAGYVAGTPAATPAFPSTPLNHVPLWYVYVPASAAAVTDDYLMDARTYWRTNDVNLFGSGLRTALQAQVDPASAANLRIPTGTAHVSPGGIAQVNTVQTYALNSIVQLGEAVPIADRTEVDHYIVAKGNGVPVGKNEPNGIVPVATGLAAVAPPNPDGTPPGGGITYRPLQVAGIAAVTFTTIRAAFIGSIQSVGGGNYAAEAGGLPLDKGGTDYAAAVGGVGGFYQINSIGKLPTVSNVAFLNAVSIAPGSVVLNRTPVVFPGGTGTMPAVLGNPGDKGDGGGGAGTNDLIVGENLVGSTWYYVYLRPRISENTLRGRPREATEVISAEAPNIDGTKPTPEAGFNGSEYCFIGSSQTDLLGAVWGFSRMGEAVYFRNRAVLASAIHNADIAASPGFTTISPLVPATSTLVIVRGEVEIAAAAGLLGDVTWRFYSPGSLGTFTELQHEGRINVDGGAGGATIRQSVGDMTLPTNAPPAAGAGIIGANKTNIIAPASFNLLLYSAGYVEPIDAAIV